MGEFTKKWILTVHVPEDVLHVKDFTSLLAESISLAATQRPRGPTPQFLLGQLERCPTTLKLHAQIALALSRSVRMSAVKTLLKASSETNLHLFPVSWLSTAHIEPAKDWVKVVAYCKKEQSRVSGPWEWGQDTSPGQRTDLEGVCTDILQGTPMALIARKAPSAFVRNYKGLMQFSHLLLPPKRMMHRKCAIFWGDSGTGKTHTAFEVYPELYTVFDIKAPWFDGYSSQSVALLDECGRGMMNVNFFKRLTDIYPMSVPVKGGSVAWNPDVIVMTSNIHVDMWFFDITEEDLTAVKRRVVQFRFPDEADAAMEWLKSTKDMSVE